MSMMPSAARFLVSGVPITVTIHDFVGCPAVLRADPSTRKLRRQRESLSPDGDHDVDVMVVWVNKFSHRVLRRRYAVGDAIAFTSPFDPGKVCVKRVVATGGEKSQPRDERGQGYAVPRGYVWVESDRACPDGGFDRHVCGAIPLGLARGRASFVFWPLSQWGYRK